jgi:hypothetical protein
MYARPQIFPNKIFQATESPQRYILTSQGHLRYKNQPIKGMDFQMMMQCWRKRAVTYCNSFSTYLYVPVLYDVLTEPSPSWI